MAHMSTYRVIFIHPVSDPATGDRPLRTLFNNVPEAVIRAMDDTGVFHIGGSPEDPLRGTRVYVANCVWADVIPMSVFGPGQPTPIPRAATQPFHADDA